MPQAGRKTHDGSIPAHTGKPQYAVIDGHLGKVYPRPHGEAAARAGDAGTDSGLSPPTRGSPARQADGDDRPGSIPAHTGKPYRDRTGDTEKAVYPRPHGEAPVGSKAAGAAFGLSPPTRGSHAVVVRSRPCLGSIPAHTGKPPRSSDGRLRQRVYPRPHGEAASKHGNRIYQLGLSPPTRGSRKADDGETQGLGSIPAHTGKPKKEATPWPLTEVYPRPHGEASSAGDRPDRSRGLSPPTRGSPQCHVSLNAAPGSIPAHTGKPRSGTPVSAKSRVYPRPHGEALCHPPAQWGLLGLSPPTRGSRLAPGECMMGPGSIPAHTGKPLYRSGMGDEQAVYPRPHGEAMMEFRTVGRSLGLSPPTRGSLLSTTRSSPILRSIPAHTGKPYSSTPAT